MEYVWYVLIGLAFGFIFGRISKATGLLLITFLAIGILGGLFGGWLFSLLVRAGIFGNLITATLISILFLWVTSYFSKPPSGR